MEKQIEFQMSFPILLSEQVRSAVDDADSFKSECSEVGKQVDRLSQMLRTVVRFSNTTPFLYERPIRRIMEEVCENLERALNLVRKCRRQSVLRRVVTLTSTTDFRKLSNLLDSSLGDMKWLLGIFNTESTNEGILLSLPPIASNEPILAWVWSYIATIQMGQLSDRVEAAMELASLAQDNDRNKKIIVEEGGIFPLLRLLEVESSPEAQIAATTVLYNLASDQERVRAIVNEDGLPIIVQVLRDAPMRVQTMAASLAARMAQHDSVAQAEFARANAIRPSETLSFESFPDEPAPPQKHDVFLSFRGEDTRKGFLSHLYHELQNTRVIKTFKDDEQLQKGTAISPNLLMAIKESRFAIILLSENYASSTWCLDELTKIFQCMKDKDTILPIFYHVNPTDVRHQKNSFEEAFTIHQKSEDERKVMQWRAALKGVAGIAGWDVKNYKTERELVEDIVKYLWKKVLEVPSGDFEAFEETKQAMDEVMRFLKDDEVTVIGVYGKGGVGKTTMVKHVGAKALKNGLFDNVIMVVVSQSPDLHKIQGTFANLLGLKLEEEDTEIGRANKLKERILRGRILIILDDIWERIPLSSIGIPSYNELKRCTSTVILTTRKSSVCDAMGCHVQIHLNILSEEDSWKLFMKKSGKSFLETTDSYDEARRVARKCAGLPSALKAAARALGDKYLDEWNETVASTFGDNEWNEAATPQLYTSQPKDERAVYHSLISDDAKSCFLLCCLFPRGYDIPIEELLKYGIGNGLFQHSDTMKEARDGILSVVMYLKASGLLLNGTKKGCIRMHDDIRDVAMSIALSEEGCGIFVKAGCELKDWPMDAHEGYSAISLMMNKLDKLPENLVCSVLQVLLLQSNAGISHIPETLFQSPNALRVFDLSFTSISLLPSSFGLLTNLQTLNLDYCNKILDISILGKLKKLEVLSMRKFPLKTLPKEIGHLTNLRMFDITGGYVDTVPSKVISRLYRLEELYVKLEFGDWGSKVENAVEETNADFDELIGLSDLNILKVYISDAACLPKNIDCFKPNWVEFDICISKDVPLDIMLSQNDQSSRTLILDTTINSLPDWFIDVVTERAEKLEYINCKGLNNIVVEYNHGRLHGLKYLSVKGGHKNLEELMNTITWVPSKPVFESLEELHLLYLQCLKQLCVGELPPRSLRKLKLLKVQTCRSLENALLPSELLQRLRNLEKIICVNMEGMKSVFGSEGIDPENIVLTKLREMRLCALSELVSIWNGPAPHAIFHNLKIVAVCKCTKLKNLFTFEIGECLVQLEDLCIEHCPNLDRVIEASDTLNNDIKLPALKKLALIDLPELRRFCTESGTIEIECPSLEYLYVENCPLFPNSAARFDSKNQIQFNDQQQLSLLVKRWEEMHIRL